MEGTPSPRHPPSVASRSATGEVAAVTTSARGRLAGELSGTPLRRDDVHQEAFESARKKFAMYGKQNAHVSHYSPDPQLARSRKRPPSSAKGATANRKAAPSPARRIVDWDDSESASSASNTMALQNTVLLQENGELAAQLDDIEYHLDGILDAKAETEEREFAMASSVVALTVLLQLEQVQTVMKVTRRSQQLKRRLREVLLRLKAYEQRMLKLSVAVLAFLLTLTAEADDFFTEAVIDGVVEALAVECKRIGEDRTASELVGHPNASSARQEAAGESKTPLKKSCLKRKKSGGTLVRRAPSSADDVHTQGSDGVKGENTLEHARTRAEREESLRVKLRSLLQGHDVFMVDGQIQLSTADLLCMLLHNILQVGGAAEGAPAESSLSTSSKQHPSQRFHQRQDLAGTTFATIMARKKQLIRNGGLQLLLCVLELRFDHLSKDIDADLVHASVSLELASAFQRVRTMLRVLDQASFLATEVQLQMSKTEMTFRVTLRLIEALSSLAWSFKSRKKWQNDPSFMQLAVDVLMSAMRVLINLSHQNEDANTHIAKLGGTKVLFLAFCKLWGAVELEQAIESGSNTHTSGMQLVVEDKLVYDAMLLILSAITNCVEYSEENRGQLSNLDLSTTTLDGLDAFRSTSACTLLVSFFVSKVQSYIHLFEMGDSQREMEGESWIPEDVVLGGCASLLLGCMMKDSLSNSAIILGALPDASPRLLLRALSAFVALHSQIGALTPEVGKSVLEVEKLLKSLMIDGGESSPSRIRVVTTTLAGTPPDLSNSNTRPRGMQTEITLKLNTMQQSRRPFEIEEVKDEESKYDDESSQLSRESEKIVMSPPASAFRFQRFSRVCSNVDDSDELTSDEDPSPAKKRGIGPVSSKLLQSPGRAKTTMNATVTFTPVRRVSNSAASESRIGIDNKGVKLSTEPRLKRTRELVYDLEAEFTKIENRVSNEINAAVKMASTRGSRFGDHAHSSPEIFTSHQVKVKRKTPVKMKTERSNVSVKLRRVSAPSSKQAKIPKTSGTQTQTPILTHKRKVKATPAKTFKKFGASDDADGVFDFPG